MRGVNVACDYFYFFSQNSNEGPFAIYCGVFLLGIQICHLLWGVFVGDPNLQRMGDFVVHNKWVVKAEIEYGFVCN
jgi:hypothetical protein